MNRYQCIKPSQSERYQIALTIKQAENEKLVQEAKALVERAIKRGWIKRKATDGLI